jgi:hypothetical protein
VPEFGALLGMPAYAGKLGPGSFLAVLKDITRELGCNGTEQCACALFWPSLTALLGAPAAQQLPPDIAFQAMHTLAASTRSIQSVWPTVAPWLHHLTEQQFADLMGMVVQSLHFQDIQCLCSCAAAKMLGHEPLGQLVLQLI